MSYRTYLQAAREAVDRVLDSQGGSIEAAAGILVNAIVSKQSIFSFGASHSFITTEEMVYRTGGLMLVNPIYPHGMNLFVRPLTATSKMERVVGLGSEMLASSPAKRGDVLLITSTSGRNAVTIDMALEAKSKGIETIGITSLAYTGGVGSRHPSGKKLVDLCDVVIDNCVPLGDSAVMIPGFPQKVGPLSSVTGCAIVNAIVTEVVDRLVKLGVEPPVFMSANLDGGDDWNSRLLANNRDRIHYLD
ncbi:MAG: SIS domain-containing protein [Fimbriimonas sp.]|nr:SIS domain-containing protein [Fimbriimonas sp.]